MTSHRCLLAALLLAFPSLLTAHTFQDWQTTNFTPAQLGNSAISGATADPDGDGLKNLQEYAFFGQPLTAEGNLSPLLSQAAGHLVLTYRERHSLFDVSIRLQGSDTLLNWITYNTVNEADRETFTGYDEVTLIDPQPFASNRRFLRLRVELLPVEEPRPPMHLSLKVVTSSSWAITWSDPNTTETGYAVERRLATDDWERLVTLGGDIGSWQHSSANYQTSMTYRVVALGLDNTESASEPITLPDTDADGLPDVFELGGRYAGVSGTYGSYPDKFSSNASEISDGWLAANGFNPAAAFDGEADTDGDGLSDAEEARRGSDPRDMDGDTDNDGVLDPEDGWPRHSWLKVSRLPEVNYAIIDLKSNGLPADSYPIQIDDKGRVLSISDSSYMTLWHAGVNEQWGASFYRRDEQGVGGGWSNTWNSDNIMTSGGYISFGITYTGEIEVSAAIIHPDGEVVLANANLEYATVANSLAAGNDGRYFVHEYTGGDEDRFAVFEVSPNGTSSLLWDGQYVRDPITRIVSFEYNKSIDGGAYFPRFVNSSGISVGTWRQNGAFLGNTSPEFYAVYSDHTLQKFEGSIIFGLTDGHQDSTTPPLIYGYKSTGLWWAKQRSESHIWDSVPLQVWDENKYIEKTAQADSAPMANERLEILCGENIIRNGGIHDLNKAIDSSWSIDKAQDINNHGVILANATRTLDDQGQPIASPRAEPILLLPVELTSEDRLVKGSITIPEGWANVALSLRATAEGGQNLGNFSGIEPGVTDSPTYIYASQNDILSESELNEAQSGAIDPRANTQAVVFYRDADNPRRLHFATAFDQVGEIKLALSCGSGTTVVTAKLKHALIAQTDTADLIATLDQRIESMTIPEIVDFDLDTDGDGLPEGGTSDLITASQPGTMAAPGAFVSEASEDNPLNLVLLVNSDDDNADSVADSLNTSLDATDNDLARIVLRAPSGLSLPPGTLTLTHNGGPALRLRFATGPPIASGTSVNLASPSGVLAGLATGPLTLYAEGLAPASDVAIVLSYTPLGESTPSATDTVRLTVIDPATLASIQVQHRYFALTGDLGGLVSRTYAANGAYRQHRVGLAPIGANGPLQNRTLLAKSLLGMIGSLKTTAAYYRGTADGFWLGLKGDWEGLQDAGTAAGSAIAFLFVENDAGRMARAVAVYEQFREIKKAFNGIGIRQIPGIIGDMASTITRDLYTDAEAALGWEPVTPGLDIQVISYMSGITTGYVGEQLVVGVASGAAAVRITTKIAPMIRGVITAVKNGTTYTLESLDDVARYSARMSRDLQRIPKSEAGCIHVGNIMQVLKRTELPSHKKVPEVFTRWFKDKPALSEDVLKILQTYLPDADIAVKGGPALYNYTRVLDLVPNLSDLSDDALKGWARFCGSIGTGPNSTAYTEHLVRVFGGPSSLDKPEFNEVMRQLSGRHPSYNLQLSPNSTNTWKTTSNLLFGQDDVYGNRIIHLMNHSITGDPAKSLFTTPKSQLINFIDTVFDQRDSAIRRFDQGNGRVRYEVDMGISVGTNGERYVALVIQDGNKFITSFPMQTHTQAPSNF